MNLLCGCLPSRLANWVKPGSIPAGKLKAAPKMAFKQMELIGMFLGVAETLVKKDELFQTVDLYECQNMVQLLTAGREGFGKAESRGTAHEWTEQQLKEGQSIIGLQMGSNKGASQAGQNFGKARSIVD
ncbi:transgelin [Elysia marginata]|uniref:Transgelin n=1 Tax=Elysia marginata TaxID=1093978 RepID=A0AAV4GBH0_9GAST|nr:transgelin [Elysia marginata]